MVEPKSLPMLPRSVIDRRWIGVMYAAFAMSLLTLATFQRADLLAQFPLALLLLVALIGATALTAARIGRGRYVQATTIVLLGLDATAALGLIAATGGYNSPMWVGLLLVSTAAPLMLPGRWVAPLLILVWLVYGLLLLATPGILLPEMVLSWSLRVAGVALVALVLHRALAAEEMLRRRAERREHALHEYVGLASRLRISSQPQSIFEEVARTIQASGEFDCVTVSVVDQASGRAMVAVAYGATGRRLRALEGLKFPWAQLANHLHERQRIGPDTYQLATLPFRSIRRERHIVLPLIGQDSVTRGVLTVSRPEAHSANVGEFQSLLTLLAGQAAAALENSTLYATLEGRVTQADETILQSRAELAEARDRSETLYQIVRTLAGTLDEREVLAQALELVQQATAAESGSMLLIEPNTGHLAVRQGHEALRGITLERVVELSGFAIARQQPHCLVDTWLDPQWPQSASSLRSLLIAPLLLDNEPLGALVLASSHVGIFDAEHVQLALAASGQIAVALSKAQLYRYVSEQSERLGQTLRQREEEVRKNQAILSSIGEGVVVCDRLDRIRMINPAAEQMLEIEAIQFLGRPMSDLPGVPSGLRAASQTGLEQVSFGSRTLRAHYTPVLSVGDDQLGSVVVFHDITRDVMADQVKSNFLATASHELRTPLTSIRGYVDLLLLGTIGALSQPQRDFLKVVKQNVGQLVDLIDDILDISKVDAGEVRLRRALADPAELIHEVAESLYSGFAEKSITLALDLSPELPALMIDRQRMRQVIVNLIGNACKYTPIGGRVDVIARILDDELRIDVRDTGVGIAREAQPYIFTPFFRADNPLRDVSGGTGLGLSITKTLVELHSGRIWFESNEGEGTNFTVTLPLQGYEWAEPAWLEQQV